MSELESTVAAARDRLNGLKAGRDSRKRRSKDKGGSSDSDGDMIPGSLMKHYESRAKKIVKLKRKRNWSPRLKDCGEAPLRLK